RTCARRSSAWSSTRLLGVSINSKKDIHTVGAEARADQASTGPALSVKPASSLSSPRDEAQALPMAVATLVNWVLRMVPRSCTVVIRKAAISAIIRPYSTIVAPSSATKNLRAAFISLVIDGLLLVRTGRY